MANDPFEVHVGKHVREIRRARGISLAELGDAVGTTYQQVQKYETGANRVSATRLWKITAHLGVDVLALLPDSKYDSLDSALIVRFDRLLVHLVIIVSDLADFRSNGRRNT